MKKVFVFVFALAVFACVAVVAILASSNDGRTTQTPQTNADKQTLEIVVQEQVTLVHEQSAQLYYHVNIPEATLQLTQQDPQIVLIDNSFKIYATQVGQTTCTITAQINQQTVSKNIVIIVEPKQVEFSCNKNAFFAGKKADDSYETYSLTINANYNFDSVDCSDNVVIYKHEKLSNNQAILFFYLTQEGFFEIVLDNFCFKKSATAFVLPPKLLVDGQPFEQKSLTLYLLEHNIEQANLQGYFASANISTSQNCFDFVVQNPQVATIQNGNLQAVGVGTTIVDIVAIDGSGFCAQIEVVVEQIKATSCSFIKSINEYELMVVGNSKITVDEQQSTLTCLAKGILPAFRIYAKIDNQEVEFLASIVSGNSAVHQDGSLLYITAVDNSVLRISFENGMHFDYLIVVA